MTNKRGRPRKSNVERAKSGRISRAKSAFQENREQIAVRMRLFGLSEKDARDQKAATVHGRMYLRQQITHEQYEAGEEMMYLRRAYLKAIKAPNGLENGTGSHVDLPETEDYVDWVQNVVSRYDAVRLAIQDAQGVHRTCNLWAALDYMLFRNEHHRHMEGDLSVLLRVLSVHFGNTKDVIICQATPVDASRQASIA